MGTVWHCIHLVALLVVEQDCGWKYEAVWYKSEEKMLVCARLFEEGGFRMFIGHVMHLEVLSY